MALTALLAASTLIAPVGGPVDATGTHLAHSRPEGGQHRLVIDGRDAPVRPRKEPFDVDLGTDARGGLVAVYTRDENVHWLDVASGRERRVPVAARSDREEVGPSVSRGRVAFAVRGRRLDRLYRGGLTGSRVVELPAPAVPRGDRLDLDETELAGDVVAVTGSEIDLDSDSGRAAVWFARGERRPRRLLSGVNSVNQSTDFIAPQVSSRWVTAGEVHVGVQGDYSRVARVAPSSGTAQRATVPDIPDADVNAGEPQRQLEGLALAGERAFTSACASSDFNEPGTAPDCRLVRTTLSWRTRAR